MSPFRSKTFVSNPKTARNQFCSHKTNKVQSQKPSFQRWQESRVVTSPAFSVAVFGHLWKRSWVSLANKIELCMNNQRTSYCGNELKMRWSVWIVVQHVGISFWRSVRNSLTIGVAIDGPSCTLSEIRNFVLGELTHRAFYRHLATDWPQRAALGCPVPGSCFVLSALNAKKSSGFTYF